MVAGIESGLVWDRWQALAEQHPEREAIIHWSLGAAPTRWCWGQLIEEARRCAQRLAGEGVGHGDVCAVMMAHNERVYPLYMGACLLGAIPAFLARPNPRLHPSKFRAGLLGMSRTSGLDYLLVDPDLVPTVHPLVTGADATVRRVLVPQEWSDEASVDGRASRRPPTDAAAPLLLQHSSGTTGLQKAVVLSNTAVARHVETYGHTIGLTAEDKVVSWLPLYHDMGLIAAFHMPLYHGVTTVQIDPFEWVTAPSVLLEVLSSEGGTLTWLPNFAYNFMADRVREDDLKGVRLDMVRLVINCSEPVRAESHDRFLGRFGRYGMRPEALSACYAMAETTFAVTQTPPGAPPREVRVDRPTLAIGSVEPHAAGSGVRRCTSSGSPIAGCLVKVVGPSGAELGDNEVGELVIRSPFMFDGYRNNSQQTSLVLRDGWYWSGDLGFRRDGEYFVVGRKKDLIIVAGKNIYPEDVEDAVGAVEGVLPGRVVAFGIEDEASGTERIAVAAETAYDGPSERNELKRRIVLAAMLIDVTVTDVFLVPPRWMIKSSAGKPSRSANRDRLIGKAEGGMPAR